MKRWVAMVMMAGCAAMAAAQTGSTGGGATGTVQATPSGAAVATNASPKNKGAQALPILGLPGRALVVQQKAKDGTTPMLTAGDLQVKVGGKAAEVTGWTPVLASSTSVELAVVIDDSIHPSEANQYGDVKEFLKGLPPAVRVLVGYMENGRVVVATRGFTADHEAAAAALRIPTGIPGGNASPYFCISDLVKRWPSKDAKAARVAMLFTNGVDNYTGANPLNQDSPYVQAAIKDAQRAGVMLYSLFVTDVGVGGGGAAMSGQSYLQMAAEGTGAQAYSEGTMSPVSFKPYLERFNGELERLYEMQFMAHGSGLLPLKVMTTMKGVKVTAADTVYVAPPEP